MKIEQVDLAVKEVENLLKVILKGLNFKHPPEITLPTDCDPMVSVDNWIHIMPFEGFRYPRTIGGRRKLPCIRYMVQVTTYDPGVRYYPDGSGQPPSEDVNDVLDTDSIYTAVKKVIEIYTTNIINCSLENHAELEQMI